MERAIGQVEREVPVLSACKQPPLLHRQLLVADLGQRREQADQR